VSTVAASTHDRLFDNALLDLASDAGELADIHGQSITAGYGPAHIVYAGDYGSMLCSSPFHLARGAQVRSWPVSEPALRASSRAPTSRPAARADWF